MATMLFLSGGAHGRGLAHARACLSLATFPLPITLRVALIKCLYTRTNYNYLNLRAADVQSSYTDVKHVHASHWVPQLP